MKLLKDSFCLDRI